MPHRHRGTFRLRYAIAAAVAVVATIAIGGTYSAQADVNTSPDYLVVYDNNIENMLPANCNDGNFDRLLSYIKKQPKSPDILTVQQISNTKQLNALTKRLSDDLPGTYAGKIAIGEPGSMGYTSPCGKLKNQQSNAVVYRSDRLTYEDATRWRSDAPKNPEQGTGGCRNLEPTKSSQDRVHNIAIRLYDKVAKQDVTAASIHWPTNTWNGPDCAAENMKEANEAVDRLGGTLKIVSGDANTTPGTKGWWNDARDYGFRDPIAEKCGTPHCPDKHDTLNDRRIDYLLVKSGHGFSKVATISEPATGGKYSDHLALTAYVKY